VTVHVRTTLGTTVELAAAPTPTPGLWVAVDPDGGYLLVHEPSQSALSRRFRDSEAALAAAIDIAAMADWGASIEDRMLLSRAIIDQISATVARWGGDRIAVQLKGA
jgi:hypothetical protein